MRKVVFGLSLVALLLVSTVVVYAGVSWDDDPAVPIGEGFWAHLQSGTDASGGVEILTEEIEGGIVDGRAWAHGCTDFKGAGDAAIRIWISKEFEGPALQSTLTEFGYAPGKVCTSMEIELD